MGLRRFLRRWIIRRLLRQFTGGLTGVNIFDLDKKISDNYPFTLKERREILARISNQIEKNERQRRSGHNDTIRMLAMRLYARAPGPDYYLLREIYFDELWRIEADDDIAFWRGDKKDT